MYVYINKKQTVVTTIYFQPTFSGMYSNLERFLPFVYKFGMLYTLLWFTPQMFLYLLRWNKNPCKIKFFSKRYLVKMVILKTLLINVLKSFQIISALLKKKFQRLKESVCFCPWYLQLGPTQVTSGFSQQAGNPGQLGSRTQLIKLSWVHQNK